MAVGEPAVHLPGCTGSRDPYVTLDLLSKNGEKILKHIDSQMVVQNSDLPWYKVVKTHLK